MPRSVARVATAKPAPYMKRLCRHFGHRVEVSFDGELGEIHMATGACRLAVTAPGELAPTATADDAESLERLSRVIGGHRERFGGRDELVVRWTPAWAPPSPASPTINPRRAAARRRRARRATRSAPA